MSIEARCPSCAFAFKVSEDQAGRRGKCPKCKADMTIPAPPEAAGVQAQRAFDRFFVESFSLSQPLPLPPEMPAAPADLKAAKAELIDARESMEAVAADHLAALGRWNVVSERDVLAYTASLLLEAGVRIKAADFELPEATVAAAKAGCAAASEGMARLRPTFEAFADAAARRMSVALGLLQNEQVAGRVAGGPIRRTASQNIYPTAAFLAKHAAGETPALMKCQKLLARMIMSIQEGKNSNNRRLLEATADVSTALYVQAKKFQQLLAGTNATPFLNEEGEAVPIYQFVIPHVPEPNEVLDLLQAVDHATDQLFTLYRHSVGRLAVAAEEVEKVLGLAPLSPPV
ncbi:MAG: hypothetical protein U0835_14535 [Isosphaeraceae bacterium]